MSYAALEAGPQQWPMPAGQAQGRARLYEDGIFPTPDGKARFANVAWQPLAEPRDARYPFSLTTGRLRDQWHGMSRTGTLGRLFGHAAEPAVEMHPQDMRRRGLDDGDLVHVTSRRGSIVIPAQGGDGIGARAGVHRDALGQRVPRRQFQPRRRPSGRERAHDARRTAPLRSSPSSSTRP